MGSNIYTDGTYFTNNPDWGKSDAGWKATIITQLLKKNKISPASIIETGCGSGHILENLSREFPNANLTGYDISPQAIAMTEELEKNNLHFYNKDIFTDQNIHTSLMLVIDVLEHVDDYYSFLENLKPKSEYFILHIPLDLACRTILKPHVLLQQRIAVGHIHYFSKEMVLWALSDKGYNVIDWEYTKPIIDTQAAGNIKRAAKKILRNLSFSISPHLSAKIWGGYSMMLLAK